MPCVAVAIAPAIDWRSMSPRFGNARPAAASSSLRRCSRIPASTRTRPVSRSTSSTRDIRSSDSCVPDVSAAAVNECPAPIAFTVPPASAARRTIDATSCVAAGCARSVASQRWFPAQFDTVVGMDANVSEGKRAAPRTVVRR